MICPYEKCQSESFNASFTGNTAYNVQTSNSLWISVFWDVMLYHRVSGTWHFEGTVILQNIVNHSPTNTVSNPRKRVNSGTVLRKPRILLSNKHIWEPRAAKLLYHRAPTLGYYGSPNHSCSQQDSGNEHMITAPFVCSCRLQSSSNMNTKCHTEINNLP